MLLCSFIFFSLPALLGVDVHHIADNEGSTDEVLYEKYNIIIYTLMPTGWCLGGDLFALSI